jgi:hypothetical protein
MPDGVLKLRVMDVYGSPLTEPVDVFMRHQTLSHDPAFRDIQPAEVISVSGLFRNPQGLYRIQVDAPSYLAVSQFVNIPASGDGELTITLPVNKDRVTSVTFPAFDSLNTDAQGILDASGEVLSFEGSSGSELYDAFDDIRKAGFLNLVAKAAHTRLLNGKTVIQSLSSITEQFGDRLFAIADPGLRSEVVHSATDDVFHPADASLHEAPAGFTLVDSYKTPDHYGNLQLTFSTNGADWIVDMDIDDAQGFEHIFQVVHNAATGQPTHPYNIHEILIEYQEIDPGYRLNVRSVAVNTA